MPLATLIKLSLTQIAAQVIGSSGSSGSVMLTCLQLFIIICCSYLPTDLDLGSTGLAMWIRIAGTLS